MVRNLHLETAERRNSISRKPIIDKTKIGKNRREIKIIESVVYTQRENYTHRDRSIPIEGAVYTQRSQCTHRQSMLKYRHQAKSNRFLFAVGLTSAEYGKLLLKTEIFCLFLKCPSLPSINPVFDLTKDFLIMLSLCVYHNLYGKSRFYTKGSASLTRQLRGLCANGTE